MKRILIIRLSAIGDVVMASSMIPVLRRAWPDAHIAWLVEPAGADLLRANRGLDEVIVWPRGEWRRLWRERRWRELRREVHGFVRDLRARRFDLALDAQGLLKSGVWARLSGASRRVGLGSREGSQWLMTERLARDANDPRIGSEYLALVHHLDLDARHFPMDLRYDDTAAARARARLREAGVHDRYAVIAPFTTRPQKHWFEDRWVTLARRVRDELGLTVVMLGGPGDAEAAARIEAAAEGGVHNLAGQTRLAESVAVIDGADLLIGVDTGLTHMGTALGRPTVALFGATRPYLDPAAPATRVIYDDVACAPCRFHPTCNGVFTCMRLITVDRVVVAVGDVLSVDQ